MRTNIITIFLLLSYTYLLSQNVGIGNADPKAALDVKGDIIFRVDTLELVDGINDNIDLASTRSMNYILTGPGTTFELGGFTAGSDGRIITLYNSSSAAYYVKNYSAGTLPVNQINTGIGTDFTMNSYSTITFQYLALDSLWHVMSRYNDISSGSSGQWINIGNDIYNGNGGNIGLGTDSTYAKLTIKSPSIYTTPNLAIRESTSYEFARIQMQNSLDNNFFWQIGTNNAPNNYDERMLFHNSRSGNLLSLTGDGNLGVGQNHIFPLGSLDVLRGSGPWGTAIFRGTDISSHFNFGTTESTLIRGGKTGSRVFINDWHNGDVLIAGGGGRTNIGSSNAPLARLEIQNGFDNSPALLIRGNDANTVFHSPIFDGSTFIRAANATGYVAIADQGSMKVGIGLTNPTATLAVARKDGVDGTAVFYGSQHASHFNYNIDENTYIRGGKEGSTVFINDHSGPVIIGASGDVNYKLSVNGNVKAREIVVENAGWPDYVFEGGYKRKSLYELEDYIEQHNHLPNIPSAIDIKTNGQALGELQIKMMEKIEELTLYIIELKKEIDQLKK